MGVLRKVIGPILCSAIPTTEEKKEKENSEKYGMIFPCAPTAAMIDVVLPCRWALFSTTFIHVFFFCKRLPSRSNPANSRSYISCTMSSKQREPCVHLILARVKGAASKRNKKSATIFLQDLLRGWASEPWQFQSTLRHCRSLSPPARTSDFLQIALRAASRAFAWSGKRSCS